MSVLSTRPSTMTERRFDGAEVPVGTAEGASMWPWHRMSQAEAILARRVRPAGRLDVGLDRLEAQGTEWLARHGILLLRVGLGVVFFWFGVLKFFPSMSPGEDLAGRTIDALTFGLVPPQVSLLLLAATETLIGLGLISGLCLRATLLVLLLQMLGTLTPLVLFPALTFAHAPYAPTLEGQYILKNIVLVAAALTIGATVRGGRLVADPLPACNCWGALPDLGEQPADDAARTRPDPRWYTIWRRRPQEAMPWQVPSPGTTSRWPHQQ